MKKRQGNFRDYPKKTRRRLLALSLLVVLSLASSLTSVFAFYTSASYVRLSDISFSMIKPAEIKMSFDGGNNYYSSQSELDDGFNQFISQFTGSDSVITFEAVSSGFSYKKWLRNIENRNDYRPVFSAQYTSDVFADRQGNPAPLYEPADDYSDNHLVIPVTVQESATVSLPVSLEIGSKTDFNLDSDSEENGHNGMAQAMRILVMVPKDNEEKQESNDLSDAFETFIINPYTQGSDVPVTGFLVCGPLNINIGSGDGQYLDTYPVNYMKSIYDNAGLTYPNWDFHEAMYGDYRLIVDGIETDPNDFFNKNKTRKAWIIDDDGKEHREIIYGVPMEYFSYSASPLSEDTDNNMAASIDSQSLGKSKKGNYQLSLSEMRSNMEERKTIKVKTEDDNTAHEISVKLLYESDEASDDKEEDVRHYIIGIKNMQGLHLCNLVSGQSKTFYIAYYFEGWDRSNTEGWNVNDIKDLGSFVSSIEITGKYITNNRNNNSTSAQG